MIIIKLEGGLGNQMFQYALGRNLSVIHKVPFKIDSSYLEKENQSGRTLRITGFKTVLNKATPEEISAHRSTLQKVLDHLRPMSKRKKIMELSSTFDHKILAHTSGYFVGHWNNEGYFKSSENVIREDFKLKQPFGKSSEKITEKILLEPEATSIHIRRGDYVSIPKIAAVHLTLPITYYKEACNRIVEKKPNAMFFIFSDDILWAKENFPKNFKTVFVSTPEIPDYEELILMSLCKHHIIANSTFSWWGAWLNQNPGKIVIAPKQWFVDKNRKTEGLICPSWIQV